MHSLSGKGYEAGALTKAFSEVEKMSVGLQVRQSNNDTITKSNMFMGLAKCNKSWSLHRSVRPI